MRTTHEARWTSWRISGTWMFAGCLCGLALGCFGHSSSVGGQGGAPEGGSVDGAGSPLFDGGAEAMAIEASSRADAGTDGAVVEASADGAGGSATPAPGQCVPTGSMSLASAFALYASMPDGKVLVVSGTTAELYDPTTGTFSPTGSPSAPRQGLPNQLVPLGGGKFLTAGGASADCGTALSSAEIYDDATGTWSPTGSLVVPRVNAIVAALPGGNVLVRGGYSAGGCGTTSADALASAEVYDAASGTFAMTASAPSDRAAATYSVLGNGSVFISTGEVYGNAQFNTTAEIYDPSTGMFTWSGTVPGTAGYGYDFTLPSGMVLVSSAFSGGTVSLFDPAGNAFGTAPQDLISAGGGCGILLSTGDVFLATGVSNGAHTPQTEIYQSSSSQWTQLGSMTTSRWVCSIAELPDGNVLIAGGQDGTGTALATAEVCNPNPPGTDAGM